MKSVLIAVLLVGTTSILFAFQSPRDDKDGGISQIKGDSNPNQGPSKDAVPLKTPNGANRDKNQGSEIKFKDEDQSVRVTSIPKVSVQSGKDVWDKGLVVATGLLVIVGGFQIGFLWSAVKAANANAIALINGERAWVMANIKWPTDRMRQININSDKTGLDMFLTFQNDGGTPVWITEKFCRLAIVDLIPEQPNFADVGDGDFIDVSPEPLSVNGSSEVRMTLLCLGKSGWERATVIYGFIKYRDVFSPSRETRFGFVVGPDNELTRIAGRPEYNKNT